MDAKAFDHKRIAKGYAMDRPWLHKAVIKQIEADCRIEKNFENGLDVGCGAGLSTKALKLICDKVTGTDISEEMIQVCRSTYESDEYDFYTAKAEETIIPDKRYDIVTAAGVINWVDRSLFLKNMKQVMRPGGLLVIYDFWISDKMIIDKVSREQIVKSRENIDKEDEETDSTYTSWWHTKYLTDFPKPARKEEIWQQQDMPEGLVMKKQVTYQLQYEFDMDTFIRFMMTQSNVNAQIEGGHRTKEEVRLWMEQTLEPVFQSEKKTFIFEGYSWYIELQ